MNLNFSIVFRWNIVFHSISFQLGFPLIRSHTLSILHLSLSCHPFVIPFLCLGLLVNPIVLFAFATTIANASDQDHSDDTGTDGNDDGSSGGAHPADVVFDVLDVTVWVVPVEWHALFGLASTPEALRSLANTSLTSVQIVRASPTVLLFLGPCHIASGNHHKNSSQKE